MDTEFWPEGLQDWTKGCPGCMAREALNTAFVELDKSCREYARGLRMITMQFALTQPGADSFVLADEALYEFTDWHHRLAERHRLSDLALVMLYYLAEQYGELDMQLRDGVAASDEYTQNAQEGSLVRHRKFESLQAHHNALMVHLGKPEPPSSDGRSELLALFADVESSYNQVAACTETLWAEQLPYLRARTAQAFKIPISSG